MEAALPPARKRGPIGGSPEHSHSGATANLISWLTQHNTALTFAAASVAPVLYLVFINRYATNSFFGDDWRIVPMVHAALHGHLSLSQLWDQYNESRLFIGKMIYVLFGFVDRLDLRSVMYFSAAALIASYAGLLTLLRQYLGKRLTPIPVLLIGVIWFSLADVSNVLWAFQVSWYLTVFFFVMMLVALLMPNNHRTLWFAVAVLLACAASWTTVQGFLCWPVGAICLLWSQPSAGRVRPIAIWLGATVVTLALYLPGYSFSKGNTCPIRADCSTTVLLHHPLTTFGFFIALIGNVIPGGVGTGGTVYGVGRSEVVGVALLVAAVFVLLHSWRHRASTEHWPLPFLLIVFSLLFDVTISIGRSATGPSGAVENNRFVMANLILLVGIVIYAWAHLPWRRPPVTNGRWRVYLTYPALFALAILLVVQATTATSFGLMSGRATRSERNQEAETLVYAQVSRVFNKERFCQVYLTILYEPGGFSMFPGTLRDAVADQLGEFRPDVDRYYHQLGPPPLTPACQPRNTEPRATSPG